MSWQKAKLGEVLTHRKGFITISDDEKYKLCRVQLHRRGVVLREILSGAAIRTKKQQVCKANDFIVAEMDAKVGGYGFIPSELDGAIVSSHYYLFEVDENLLKRDFLAVLNKAEILQNQIKATGSTNYASVRPSDILQWEVPLPPIEQQDSIANKVLSIEKKKETINIELSQQLALVKELRQAYLREAMQGKLVAQNEADEPAQILLEKIKAEKARLIKEKKIKQGKPLPPIKPEEIPFEIPANWAWCRLGEISNSMSTGPFGTMLHQSDYVKAGIPLINPMNIVNGKIVPSEKMGVSEETKQRLISYTLEAGDIVIARRGEMGRCAIVSENENGWLCGTGSFFIKLSNFIDRNYFVKFFSSEFSKSYLTGFSVGATMNNLNHRILNKFPFPLPPLAEQERIVAKLEKLMTFCDEMETNIKQARANADLLLQVALKEALRG
jgi:type I restriction enzyme S subunit